MFSVMHQTACRRAGAESSSVAGSVSASSSAGRSFSSSSTSAPASMTVRLVFATFFASFAGLARAWGLRSRARWRGARRRSGRDILRRLSLVCVTLAGFACDLWFSLSYRCCSLFRFGNFFHRRLFFVDCFIVFTVRDFINTSSGVAGIFVQTFGGRFVENEDLLVFFHALYRLFVPLIPGDV